MKNATKCKTIDQITCYNNKTTVTNSNNFLSSECLPLCPLECNRTILKTSSSSSSYGLTGELYYDYIQDNPNLLSHFVNKPLSIQNAIDSFTSIAFYYESNSYTLSTDTPSMDMVSLLANLGGTLGLFIGISLIQLCEIIDVLIQIILIKAKVQH